MNDNGNTQLSEKVFSWRDGRHWFDVGISLFKQVKNFWYLNCLLLGVLVLLIANIAIGLVAIVVIFASPLITAYMMNACKYAASNEILNFSMLWQQIVKRLNAFMLLGVISALLSVASYYIHIQLLHVFNLPVDLTEDLVAGMTGKEALLRAVLNVITSLPIALALAFSPALVLFQDNHPFQGVKYSVLGVIRSWKAFVTLTLLFLLVFFGVVLLASFVIAIIMAVMGPSSQILVNIVVLFFAVTAAGIGLCAQYQAYTEVFQDKKEEGDHDTEIYAEI